MTTITVSDCYTVRYCKRGARMFLELCGIDYDDFLRNGIDREVLLEKTNHDPMVVSLLKAVDDGRRRQ